MLVLKSESPADWTSPTRSVRAAGRAIPRRSSAVLLLAASLAAGACGAQVERAGPPPAPQGKAPAGPQVRNEADADERDLDDRLAEARKRLEAAASEVAALSAEAATRAMREFSTRFGPQRTVIGVQLAPEGDGQGPTVQAVSPGGPAEQAGIRPGDVIVSVNGQDVKGDAGEVVRLLRDVEPESKVKVRVLRDGRTHDFDVVARPVDVHKHVFRTHTFPPDFRFDFNFEPGIPGFPPRYGLWGDLEGLELTSLTPQLGRYFGTDKGLLVVRAPKESRYRLQDGDVILNIDGRVPSNSSHFMRILRSYQPGETVTLRIMRDRKPVDVKVTLPEEIRPRNTRARNFHHEATEL